jgi:hypothetical protein
VVSQEALLGGEEAHDDVKAEEEHGTNDTQE